MRNRWSNGQPRPRVQPFLALHQPGCFEQAQLERPAVGAGPFGRPPPVALEAPAEGTEVPANSPVALAHDQGGVELVIGAVTVAGVDLGGVPEATFGGAVEPSLGADQQGQRPQLAVSGPPAIALGTVELHPPVAIGITEPRPHALHHQPRHLSWHRRRPEGAGTGSDKGAGASDRVRASRPLRQGEDGHDTSDYENRASTGGQGVSSPWYGRGGRCYLPFLPFFPRLLPPPFFFSLIRPKRPRFRWRRGGTRRRGDGPAQHHRRRRTASTPNRRDRDSYNHPPHTFMRVR